ncbi:hypothetical protein CKO44_01510 [Rubrivivax gelatinosus]|uniref:carbon-nitrogen hydrolase family protein n=1 Tax=Rubrivivax gelatinosus TaxID=28068 RepID=UPI001906BACA|nr:carbon-nitrogen hydrolase family protein [Rubrivivax gelatinosus]MBK1612146.1 hypothetical protein [Rubrivivax gelatinosus]MBZ8143069.1 hypothetical protein [Rubrivivax gelatinosus]
MLTSPKIAIAQIAMHWTTAENTASIERAMNFASSKGAQVCGFSELAVTGFHREIGREARANLVRPAVERIRALAAHLSLGVAVGAPTFGTDGTKFNTHLLIDEQGMITAEVPKRGLTDPEATFFARGSSRPVGSIQRLRCSAVICREVTDLDHVRSELPPGTVDLIFVPGALRQDPEMPRTDPPEYVRDIQRLAAATRAYVVHTNWPNALNRPEESVDAGGSVVANPDGEVLFRLPMQESGIGIFTLGERTFTWHPQ